MSLGKPEEIVKDREAGHATVYGVAKSWTQLSDWTELMASLPTPTLFFTFFGYFLSYMNFWMSVSVSILTFHLAISLSCIEFINFEAIDIFIIVVSFCIPK